MKFSYIFFSVFAIFLLTACSSYSSTEEKSESSADQSQESSFVPDEEGAIDGVLAKSVKKKNVKPSSKKTTKKTSTVTSPTTKSPSKDTASGTKKDSSVVMETKEVTIKDFAFSPASLTVKKGTTIVWTNLDSPQHNAFSSTKGGPEGPLLATNKKYNFKADTIGTFDYICQPHPFMKGTIVVTE